MEEIISLKLQNQEIEVEYEIFSDYEVSTTIDLTRQEIRNESNLVEAQLSANQQKIEMLNREIYRLTNHADGLDYMVAVASGILAGLVDSFLVGAFDFGAAKAWSNQQVNEFVMKVARERGYEGDRLNGAIRYLENAAKIPSDNTWKGITEGISTRSHHLDDLAHHPTPIGLFFSILTQFTHSGYFHNAEGEFLPLSIDENGIGLIGNDITSKIFAGTVNWFFHLVSDMAGSNKTAGVGMGIPGPILSLLKELSAVPGFDKTDLARQAKQAFVKGRFDLRSELAVCHELGKQAMPVILNEVIVRAFYFIRRLVNEITKNKGFGNINWANTLPFKNRTIVRMVTIATGTFTVVDMGDAAIRAGSKSGGALPLFFTEFVLHVNFVGVGRFAVAVGTDVSMGVKRSKARNELMRVYCEQLHYMNAKIFYAQAGMWVAAESTQQTINEAFVMMEQAVKRFEDTIKENSDSLTKIGLYAHDIDQTNPGMKQDILKELNY